MQTLKHYNINIPGEVALAGYSNDFACSVTAPGLTSIEQHTKEMGNMAANLFLEQANSNQSESASRKTVLNPRLVVRESSERKGNKEMVSG